jgi:multiple sugar transport system permease protein
VPETLLHAAHRRSRRQWFPYLSVAPYVLFLLLFGLGPAFYAIVMSLFDTTGSEWRFNTFANFSTITQDMRFGSALSNVLLYLLFAMPATIVVVLAIALLLHARVGRFSDTLRSIFYIPTAVASSASVLIWTFMFSPQTSPFAPILSALGYQSRTQVLSQSHLPVVFAIMALWTSAGFWIVVVYGALMGIPDEVLEAAVVDGCNELRIALSIKLPLIAKYIVFMLILSFSGGVQLFVEPQIMSSVTQGLVSPTWSLNQLAFSYAFDLGNFGVAAAMSVGMLVVGLVGALLIIFKSDFYRIDV